MIGLVWASMLLLLTVVGSTAGLAGMIGMPIGPMFLAPILVLTVAVVVLGVVLVVAPQPRLVSAGVT